MWRWDRRAGRPLAHCTRSHRSTAARRVVSFTTPLQPTAPPCGDNGRELTNLATSPFSSLSVRLVKAVTLSAIGRKRPRQGSVLTSLTVCCSTSASTFCIHASSAVAVRLAHPAFCATLWKLELLVGLVVGVPLEDPMKPRTMGSRGFAYEYIRTIPEPEDWP